MRSRGLRSGRTASSVRWRSSRRNRGKRNRKRQLCSHRRSRQGSAIGSVRIPGSVALLLLTFHLPPCLLVRLVVLPRRRHQLRCPDPILPLMMEMKICVQGGIWICRTKVGVLAWMVGCGGMGWGYSHESVAIAIMCAGVNRDGFKLGSWNNVCLFQLVPCLVLSGLCSSSLNRDHLAHFARIFIWGCVRPRFTVGPCALLQAGCVLATN